MPTYSAKDVSITWGILTLSGYAPDSFCEIDFNDDMWKLQVGAGGEFIRSQSNNLSATITVKLLASSASNPLLSAAMTADQVFRKSASTLQVQNLNTKDLFQGSAWIKKAPKKSFSAEAQTLEWVFESGLFTPILYGYSSDT